MKLNRFQLFFQSAYLKFTKYIFDKGEEDIKPLLNQQDKDMKSVLIEVSNVMLKYNIKDSVMNMSESDQRKEKTRLDKVIEESFKSQYKTEQKQITNILNEDGENKYNSNSYLFTLDKQNKRKRLNTEELKKIISEKVEGANYSERLWADKNQVASTLQKEIKKFMQGKTSVNNIQEVIEKRFKANENNTKRIVATEIARVQAAVSDRWCKDNGVEFQLFSVVLDGVTSKTCRSHANDKPYRVDDPGKPIPPLHPFCRSTLIPITPEGYRPNIPKDDVSWQSYEEWERNDSVKHDEGDILNKAKLLFDSQTRDKIKEFKGGLKDVRNNNVRTLLDQSQKRTNFAKSKKKGSYFNPDENTVYLKEGAETSTVAHELFHEIDYKYGISKDNKIIEQIQNDYSKLKNTAMGYGKEIDEMLYSKYPEIFKINDFGDKVVLKQYRGMSDIIHGMSSGKINLGYGHFNKGYWERENALSKETWAQYGRMLYENDDKVIKVLNEIFPETSSQIIKLLKEMVK